MNFSLRIEGYGIKTFQGEKKKYTHRVGFAEWKRECEKSNEKLLIS